MRGQRPRNPDLRRTTSRHVRLLSPVPLRAPPSRESLTVAVKSLRDIDRNYAGTRGPRTACGIGEFMQVPGIIAVPA